MRWGTPAHECRKLGYPIYEFRRWGFVSFVRWDTPFTSSCGATYPLSQADRTNCLSHMALSEAPPPLIDQKVTKRPPVAPFVNTFPSPRGRPTPAPLQSHSSPAPAVLQPYFHPAAYFGSASALLPPTKLVKCGAPPYFSPTSALLHPYFSPTSALLRLYFSSTSALLQPYFSPTSALLQLYFSSTSALLQLVRLLA